MTARCRPVGCVGKVGQTQLGLAVHTLGIIHKLYIFYDAKVIFISDLCKFFEEKKCILKADLLKKKVLSSRITYSVIDVNVYI